MEMTKAEKAAVERLEADLAKAKALRWPDYRPELLDCREALANTPYKARYGSPLAKAWGFNSHDRGAVFRGCFTTTGHSTWSDEDTNSQNMGGPWFPTKRDALMALRIAKADEFAAILAKIDQQIAEAEGE